MSTPNAQPPILMKFLCRFIAKGSRTPVGGPGYSARFMDKDLLKSDTLGTASVGPDGKAECLVPRVNMKGWDSPGETKPDVYVVLLKDGKELFRSPTIKNMNLAEVDPTTKEQRTTFDLGAFEV